MKKISIVLPDLRGGGAERLHLHLAKDWVDQGFEVEFILMRERGDLLPLVPVSVGVISLGVSRIRSAILPLRKHLRAAKSDFVLAALWPLTSAAVIAWLLAGRPGRLFVSDHNQLSISCVRELYIPAWLLKLAIGSTYPFASGIIAVSEGVKKDISRLGNLNEGQVQVIYNPTAIGISSHRETAEVRNSLWGSGFQHHVLSVGTLKPQKDHATLLRAFALLPSSLRAKLTILGEGGLREDLTALATQLNLGGRVSMPGFLTDPYPWFRSADVFVLSSAWEGFGNVIVEALECGVPVVSTDCPSGPAEILDNGRFGHLVPPGDAQALAAAILQALQAPVSRETMFARAKEFSVPVISRRYLRYLEHGT